jgi:hypothetical protein
MALWYFGRNWGERRRLFPIAVHFTALVFFVLVLLLAVFVFVSRLL